MVENKIEVKRYQELSKPYRIALWFRWMPWGYIKGLGWYFIKRLRWEDVSDDEEGRISLGTCIGICVGTVQGYMKWYYRSDEIFGKNGEFLREHVECGLLEKVGDFIEDKFVEMVDGKTIYD